MFLEAVFCKAVSIQGRIQQNSYVAESYIVYERCSAMSDFDTVGTEINPSSALTFIVGMSCKSISVNLACNMGNCSHRDRSYGHSYIKIPRPATVQHQAPM